MNLKRNKLIYSISRVFTEIVCNCIYDINYSGYENIPKQGPALLLPKHQNNLDIIFEGLFLYKAKKRQGNWIMKSNLPGILQVLGGVGVDRAIDVKRQNYEKKRNYLKQAKEKRQEVLEYIKWLYLNNELVIVHPEGARNIGKIGKTDKSIIKIITLTKEIQSGPENIFDIPVIPIGIEYKKSNNKTKVYVRAGKPLDIYNPNFTINLEERLGFLSNIKN